MRGSKAKEVLVLVAPQTSSRGIAYKEENLYSEALAKGSARGATVAATVALVRTKLRLTLSTVDWLEGGGEKRNTISFKSAVSFKSSA